MARRKRRQHRVGPPVMLTTSEARRRHRSADFMFPKYPARPKEPHLTESQMKFQEEVREIDEQFERSIRG